MRPRRPRPIRVVAFDLMDTVVRDPFREALRAATGLPIEDLFARRPPDVYPAFERDELEEAAYWAMYDELGLAVDPSEFHRVRIEGTTFLDGMAELLDDLAGRVVRATASNYPRWVDDLADTLLVGRFDEVVASCHLGARKPDVVFYERLLERLGCAPGEVLFVDDREVNVEAARAVGIAAHRFDGADGVRAFLADHDVLSA